MTLSLTNECSGAHATEGHQCAAFHFQSPQQVSLCLLLRT